MEEQEITSNEEMASTPATLAHKMVYFIYDRQACEKETWEISFWNEFRRTNADVTMDAKSLRTFFFHGIMQNSDYLEDLRREVLEYINPLFNRLRQEVLEFRDLVEGIDYVHDQPHTVTLEENRLPPLQLQSCHPARTTPTSASSKRFVTPSPAQIQSFVADEMSELVWIEEERSSNQTLSINECLQRMAMLTHQGIPLKDCIEPGMKCFERFSTHNESTRMLRQGEAHIESDIDDSASMRLPHPIVSSTPIIAMQTNARAASPLQSESSRAESSGSEPSTSYRSRDYTSVLRHVRSKPRKVLYKI